MNIELQYKIKSDINQRKFLRENSYWYKYLNRSNIFYKDFINDMKDKYKLKPSDKINKISKEIEMINKILDILK